MSTLNTDVESLALSDHHSFVIGQDPEGHWLAVETHGLGGGIFRSRADAVHYARFEADHAPDAFRFASEPIAFTYPKLPRSDAVASGHSVPQGR